MPSKRGGLGKVRLFMKCVNERTEHPRWNLLPSSEWKAFVTARVRLTVNSYPWEHQEYTVLRMGILKRYQICSENLEGIQPSNGKDGALQGGLRISSTTSWWWFMKQIPRVWDGILKRTSRGTVVLFFRRTSQMDNRRHHLDLLGRI